jgi:hypothetical protein
MEHPVHSTPTSIFFNLGGFIYDSLPTPTSIYHNIAALHYMHALGRYSLVSISLLFG